VGAAQLSFVEDWHWATGKILELDWKARPVEGGKASVLIIPTGPADEMETAMLMFVHAINSAKERIWIASPYFVPDEQFITALQLAALRGVDVRIIVPANTDDLLANLSQWSYLEELETVGIRVFRHEKGFMHQKVLLVDDDFATVGTANFDNRSFRLNFEITLVVVDREFNEAVAQMLEADIADSRLATAGDFQAKPCWFRFAARLARLTAPIQ
jgi:cardiolipin synthase